MTNEFPPRYLEVMRECSGSPTPAVNVTEYLEALAGRGISREDPPPVQPLLQHRVWERFEPGEGPERLAAVIGQLTAEDARFSMEGGSWTSDISWMREYDNVLAPMERGARCSASTWWHRASASDPRYRRALFYLLAWKPAAPATGARASGRTTAPSPPAAPARPPARRPDRRAARTAGNGGRAPG